MRCPKCGSKKCQFITTTNTHSSGFGWFDACCGFLILGPVGILCGLCGSGTSTTTKEYWICNECGRKFQTWEGRSAQGKHLAEKNDYEECLAALNFYYENSYKYPELQGRQEIKEFDTAYKNYISELHGSNNIVIRTEKTEALDAVTRSVDIDSLRNEVIMFAYKGLDGFFVTLNGIYFDGRRISYSQIVQAALYQNSIYINQWCMRFPDDVTAKNIFKFLKIFVKDKCQIYEDYEILLESIHKLNIAIVDSDSNHYAKQTEYKEYIHGLTEKKLNEYKDAFPQQYDVYRAFEKNKDDKMGRSLLIWLGIIMLITIILCVKIGIIGGIICGVIAAVIAAIIWYVYYESGKYDLKNAGILPDELVELIKEDQNSEKKGRIRPSRYSQKYIKIYYTNENNFCTKCGKKLEKNWNGCPYCGASIKK